MKKIHIILIILSLLIINYSNSQSQKFGKIKADVLTMAPDPLFPDASAMVLFDVGDVKIDFVSDAFQIVQKRHIRIKIFSKDGYEYADVILPRYLKEHEKYRTISANVFNLDEKGKIVKEKVSSKSIFDEDIDKRVNRKRFSFPSVKEGSVIEYKYEVVSERSFRIIDWDFQHDIPVKYSKFEVSYPDYFTYITKYQGDLPFKERETSSHPEKIQFTESKPILQKASSRNADRDLEQYSMDLNYKDFLYIMEDIPPMVEEPYMGTLEDFRAKLIHQYKSYKIPGRDPHVYISSWNTLGERMYEDSDFYGQLRFANTFKKELQNITSESASKLENMIAIYDFVKKSFKWNGLYRKFPTGNIVVSYDNKEGTSSDINMFLTYLLRHADFETYPVLISTRSHGAIDMTIPILKQFNSVINLTVIDGQNYFLDATNPLRPYNLLNEQDLYSQGFVIKKYEYNWIPVSNTFKSKEIISLNLNLSEDGYIDGVIEGAQTGYYSLETREGISKHGTDDYFAGDLSGEGFNYDFSVESIENKSELINPLKFKIKVSTNSFTQKGNDMIYLQPLLHLGTDQNPFMSEERNYPIDFYYSRDRTISLNLSVPEGYEVIEFPKAIKLSLPQKGGTFYFICQVTGNKIQLNSKINLNKTQYSVNEYTYIKAFFDQIVAKQNEQIVLKLMN